MVDPTINKTIRQFFISARVERKDTLQNNISKTLGNLQSHNMVNSSVAVTEVSAVYAEELKLRSFAAWESIKVFFEKGNITFNKNDAKEIEELLKQHILNEEKNLSREVQSRFTQMIGPLDFKNSILIAIASSKNTIFPKISAELNFYTDSKSTNNTSIKVNERDDYADRNRIEELKNIVNQGFDLTRLIKLCEEINIAHRNDCFMSIAMIMRAIIDHIPPIFSVSSFPEVANNYGGSKSFKDSMQLLQRSLRNVADSHLHVQIRNKETLPNFTQVNFKAELDLLLSEIVRLLK